MNGPTYRVVSIVEAVTVTGPMKPLLMFASPARQSALQGRSLQLSLLTTVRDTSGTGSGNAFTKAAGAAGVAVDACFERFPGDPRVLDQMADHLTRLNPDLVETHNFKSHFLFWLLRRRRGNGLRSTPWVAFHHGYTQTSWRVKLYQLLDSITLPKANRVVTLCEPFVQQLVARGVERSRIEIISNAVEPRPAPGSAAVFELRQRHGISAEDRVLLSVGRLSSEKGGRDLLDAFRKVLDQMPDTKLTLLLLGDGPDRAMLEEYGKDLGKRLCFAGHLTDVWPYYFLSDVFVLPSHSEGSPLALLEAMAAGCAIVATRVGGVPETVVEGQSGLLVSPRDPGALAQALIRILTEPSLAASLRNGALSRGAQFTPERYTYNLLGIHGRALTSRPCT